MNRVAALLLFVVVMAPAQDTPAGGEVKPRVIRDLVYKHVGEQQLKLTLYYPTTGKAPFPTALVIPGGGWRFGSRRSRNAVSLAKLLNRDGVVCATMDYRPAPLHPHPAQIEDCRRAMQWLRANEKKYKLNGARMMACGTSAGGHLAALLGAGVDRADPAAKDPVARMSTRPAMVLSFFGPMDLSDERAETNAMGRRLVWGFLGIEQLDDAARARARDASPLHQLAPGAPPFLFIHGDRDRLVPPKQSKLMAAALKKVGVPNEVHVVPGSHGDFTYRLGVSKPGEEPEYWKKARLFMDRHWRGGKVRTATVPGR